MELLHTQLRVGASSKDALSPLGTYLCLSAFGLVPQSCACQGTCLLSFSAADAQIHPARLLPLVPQCWAGRHCLQVCLRGRFYVWQHSAVLKSTLKRFCSDLALVTVGRRYRGGPFCCSSHAVPPVGCRIPPQAVLSSPLCPQPQDPGAGVMGGATGHPGICWS